MLINDSQALHRESATDLRSRTLEAARQQLGHGTCADSMVRDMLVSAHDLLVDGRRPGLAEALSDADAVSVLGVPVRIGGAALLSRGRDALATQLQDALRRRG